MMDSTRVSKNYIIAASRDVGGQCSKNIAVPASRGKLPVLHFEADSDNMTHRRGNKQVLADGSSTAILHSDGCV